jgi:hypothetical protein
MGINKVRTDASPPFPWSEPHWSEPNLQRLLQLPAEAVPLICTEHHRQIRLVGQCPWCALRAIEARLADGYGFMPAERVVTNISEIIGALEQAQLQRRAAASLHVHRAHKDTQSDAFLSHGDAALEQSEQL